jgi:hypothetical protein
LESARSLAGAFHGISISGYVSAWRSAAHRD